MKLINFLNQSKTLLAAGVFACAFASCDSNQSTERGGEEIAEEENMGEAYEEIYEDNELETTNVADEVEYDYNQEYGYTDRPLVERKVEYEIDRIDRNLERMEEDWERTGEALSAEAKQEWEENKMSLEREREQLNMRLQELENSTEENWNDVRASVNNSLQEFEREWEKLDDIDIDVDVEREAEND